MTSSRDHASSRDRLAQIAAQAMRERGLEADFPADALSQVQAIGGAPEVESGLAPRDLRALPWCSIDNDDSKDLDQLSVSERLSDGRTRVLVAIADVDVLVAQGSPIDRHASVNTTSVYTPARVFPMLPTRLSTDLTSLNQDVDRLAVVTEMTVARDGTVTDETVYAAVVRNQARLVYDDVDRFLTSGDHLGVSPAMLDQLRNQDEAAQALSTRRHELGALDFELPETRVQFDDGHLKALESDRPNRAKDLIQNLMIATNGVVARFLDSHGSASIRRVVKAPARWDRIQAIASGLGTTLPDAPDSPALARFLAARKAADPGAFHELSHAIIKLVGAGEYLVDTPSTDAPGHFALAVKDYAHSTAPNRRYTDLITQRLLKAVLRGRPAPYSVEQLTALARLCTTREDDANRVERQVRKSAAAMLIADRVGQHFDAVVTGASPKGTYVRTMAPHIEGRVVRGTEGLDVGESVRVQLVQVDIDRGFIDFAA